MKRPLRRLRIPPTVDDVEVDAPAHDAKSERRFALTMTVVIAAICLGQAAGVGYEAIIQIRAVSTGIPGALVVGECRDLGTAIAPKWDCTGRFVSHDGTVAVEHVRISWLSKRPGETIDVRLPDEDATIAVEDASLPTRVLIGLFWSCVLLVMLIAVIVLCVKARSWIRSARRRPAD